MGERPVSKSTLQNLERPFMAFDIVKEHGMNLNLHGSW
jgi:hypothetical protein